MTPTGLTASGSRPAAIARPLRLIATIGAVGLFLAACATTATDATTATVLPETTTIPSSTTTIAPSTTTAASSDAAAIAASFMEARQDRRIDEAKSYLDRAVVLEWGPGQSYETLTNGLAWEDAFGVEFSLTECTLDTGAPSGRTRVTCLLATDTAIAAAVGNEAGNVCVSVDIEGDLIIRVELLGARDGCEYQFWGKAFVPFNAWVVKNHPESDPTAMYDDRISSEGLALWVQYTREFLAEHGG